MKVGDLVRHKAEYKLRGTVTRCQVRKKHGFSIYLVFWFNSRVSTWETQNFIEVINESW